MIVSRPEAPLDVGPSRAPSKEGEGGRWRPGLPALERSIARGHKPVHKYRPPGVKARQLTLEEPLLVRSAATGPLLLPPLLPRSKSNSSRPEAVGLRNETVPFSPPIASKPPSPVNRMLCAMHTP